MNTINHLAGGLVLVGSVVVIILPAAIAASIGLTNYGANVFWGLTGTFLSSLYLARL